MGDVVNVKSGFARNFLLPQSKALRATKGNRAVFEVQRAQLEADNLKNRAEAQSVGDKMDGESVVLVRQAGDAGQLYGSVSARDIAVSLTENGFTVTRSQVILTSPIKTIGIHAVSVTLHPEVTVQVTVNVARSEEEAVIQAKTGSAALSMEEAERQADEAEAAALAAADAAAMAESDDAADEDSATDDEGAAE